MMAVTEPWTGDERAAARAFLQRSEVRLGTIHRVATALLSGAGLMVLLPAIARDAVTTVLRALLDAEPSVAHLLLAIATIAVLGLPLVAFVVVLRDLTTFYFHGQHLETSGGEQLFAPRFTLTGLRLPSDDTTATAAEDLARARYDSAAVELIVPAKDSQRRRIDQQLDAYGASSEARNDIDRADALMRLVAARERTLAEEVTKVEYGMARHLSRIQVIVLRYVKALLLFLVTSLAVFAAAGAVATDVTLGTNAELWMAVIYLAWSAGVVAAAGDPVRTIERLLRAEGATRTALGADRELTRVERYAVVTAAVVAAVAVADLVIVTITGHPTRRALIAAVTTAAMLVASFVAITARWAARLSRA
jgi:hypothetical protein